MEGFILVIFIELLLIIYLREEEYGEGFKIIFSILLALLNVLMVLRF